MTHTNKLFELAQLAEASYANFLGADNKSPLTDNQLKARLINLKADGSYDFSVSQADEFIQNWQVITQQPDTASSFSGTLFKYIGNDPNSGFQNCQYVYALKGTLEMGANLAGVDVGDIVLVDQIVDMYNDWHYIQAGLTRIEKAIDASLYVD